MKRLWMCAAIVMCIALSGCMAPHANWELEPSGSDTVSLPEETPAPDGGPAQAEALPTAQPVGEIVYRPDAAPSAFAEGEDFSQALYALLVDGVRAGSDTVDASSLTFTDAQLEGVRGYLLSRNPWGTLTDITRGEGSLLNISYAVEDTQQRAEQAQRFDQAVEQLLRSSVSPESTQLAAALSLYKSIAQTVTEEYEAEDGGLYSALVQGEGVDRTYAYAYGFLLDQIGVENTVVFSGDGSHAWNVLTMDGQSFHCDPKMEAGLNGGQALTCFGLSDSEVTQRNGWNTWESENHVLLTCPSSILDQASLAPYADVDALGGALFFSRMDGVNGVFRFDLGTGEVLQVVQAEPAALAVLGENVYYLDSADSGLYRYRPSDGDVRQALEGVTVLSMRRVVTELRYVDAADPDGNESAISIE